jgi:hypothetical protein
MPFVIWIVIRIARALHATGRLLASPRTLRALPWGYIRGLPRHDRWIGVLCVTIPVTLLGVLVVLIAPEHAVRTVAWSVAGGFALLGVASSWLRLLARPKV